MTCAVTSGFGAGRETDVDSPKGLRLAASGNLRVRNVEALSRIKLRYFWPNHRTVCMGILRDNKVQKHMAGPKVA